MKENKENVVISKATIDRLPLYYRTLKISQEEGIEIISSDELGRKIGVTPEQIRKDLSAFGEFGKKGVGYYVRELMRNIGEILGLNRKWNIAIVGVGHLGWALANYANFSSQGFQLQAIFDVDDEKIGRYINEVQIFHIDEIKDIVQSRNIEIGIITVPAQHAQSTAMRLVEAGIKGIWNFAPIKLDVPDNIHVVSEDLSVGLNSISYYLSRQNN
ncbi:redox-sensing transcriptional repressor Rex [Sporomusa acidovorans]|uniref:Redox-sensing transcriptional repressor Rex n=1 Tax=Sporomusa acidovorans (strain ATCC 49682 / DSM 3132 / Mol) TaxID=1123286 RepID=A0ABZ3J0Y3_SPOA4|nr:redox-sensing transcriptional repressor Rex [Sporomusa acidovorans]OZC22479.1 redox-sensing transcriptional repressor Rex [Sporomusa acidovorans DSM 3132]SDE73892.1 redox-sensing transcriptional repressor [Sporomusa acidovorans]